MPYPRHHEVTPGDKIASIAIDESAKKIREDDGSNRDKGREIAKYWIGSEYPNGWNARAPYCCAFATWCAVQAGVPVPRFVSCSRLAEWARKGGSSGVRAALVGNDARPPVGSFVLVDTDQSGQFNHVGIVVALEGSTVWTVEANTTGRTEQTNDPTSIHSGVHRRRRAFGLAPISGFVVFDPDYTIRGDSLAISSEQQFIDLCRMEKNAEKRSGFQSLLNAVGLADLDVDGKIGPLTEKALRELWRRTR